MCEVMQNLSIGEGMKDDHQFEKETSIKFWPRFWEKKLMENFRSLVKENKRATDKKSKACRDNTDELHNGLHTMIFFMKNTVKVRN